ncbi:MAG: hypothetical protein NZ867_00755 [SAR324 cluster bacterium]|nr:hypothetical protein [SAR324 cluster bacterium]
MSSFNDNYRFFSFVSLGILALFLSTTIDVLANEVEEVLATNKRVWSVIKSQNSLIEGKIKINESSKPKNGKLHSPPQTAKTKKSIRRDSRFWSVVNTQSKLIDGKVKINKSSYSAEKVRASTSKMEQPHSAPQTAKVKGSIRKESRRSYATNSKGSSTSILENANAVKPFCNINATTAFCIRHGESHHKYTGNTPRRHPRLLDYRDVNSKSRKHESKAFFQQLVRQSNR